MAAPMCRGGFFLMRVAVRPIAALCLFGLCLAGCVSPRANEAAALLAEGGFTGPLTVFDGTNGMYKAFAPSKTPDFAPLIDGLGESWVLETLADIGQREKDVHTLTEYARIALRRQISHRHAPEGRLRALMLAPDLEAALRDNIRVAGGVHQLALDPQAAQALVERFVHAIAEHAPDAVVTPVDLRRHVRKLIEGDAFDTPVLSYQELVPTLKLDLLAHVGQPPRPLLQAA